MKWLLCILVKAGKEGRMDALKKVSRSHPVFLFLERGRGQGLFFVVDALDRWMENEF